MRNQDWDPETLSTPEENHAINVIAYLVLLMPLLALLNGAINSVQSYKRHEEIEKQRQIRIASDRFQYQLKKERWEREHNAPEREIFRKRSENFIDKADENALDIIIEISTKQLKKAHVGVTNYLSNVGGKIYKTENKANSIHDTKLYYLKVPQGAKFVENLEEELGKYLEYDDAMEINDNEEIKSE